MQHFQVSIHRGCDASGTMVLPHVRPDGDLASASGSIVDKQNLKITKELVQSLQYYVSATSHRVKASQELYN